MCQMCVGGWVKYLGYDPQDVERLECVSDDVLEDVAV